MIKFYYRNAIIFDKPCIRIFAYEEEPSADGSHKSFDIFFPYNGEGDDYLLNKIFESIHLLMEHWNNDK